MIGDGELTQGLNGLHGIRRYLMEDHGMNARSLAPVHPVRRQTPPHIYHTQVYIQVVVVE